MNVDVMYQGLALVKGANARAEGGRLFVELEAPMPVGTRLELVTPDGTRSGRVESVIEGVGAGMLVDFSGAAKSAGRGAPRPWRRCSRGYSTAHRRSPSGNCCASARC